AGDAEQGLVGQAVPEAGSEARDGLRLVARRAVGGFEAEPGLGIARDGPVVGDVVHRPSSLASPARARLLPRATGRTDGGPDGRGSGSSARLRGNRTCLPGTTPCADSP